MPWNPGLTQLRDLLAELYPTIQLSREVVEMAGLPASRIAFNPAAKSNWHNILKEAQRRNKVGAIVAVACEEYPEMRGKLTQAELASRGEAIAPVVASPSTSATSAAVVRDLLLAAFTADNLRRLFVYTSNMDLKPVVNEFGPNDSLASLADKAIIYCQKKDLLPALLAEVKAANPRQYARFEPLL
jgi:hypothetical protein